jgi:transcriptional regulator with XRE-family HTH domain
MMVFGKCQRLLVPKSLLPAAFRECRNVSMVKERMQRNSVPGRIQVGDRTVDGTAVGRVLRRRRETLELSLDAVAKRAGLAAGTVHAVEHGNLSICLDNFLRLLGALGLSLIDVFGPEICGVVEQEKFAAELRTKASANLPELLEEILRSLRNPGIEKTLARKTSKQK